MAHSGISTEPRVPWPPEWQNLRRRRAAVPVALLLVAPLGLFGAVVSMLYAVQYGLTDFPIRVLAGAALLLMVPYVVLTKRSLRRQRKVSSIRPGRLDDQAGIVFWYSAALTAAHLGLVFGGAAYYGTLLAVAWPVNGASRWTVESHVVLGVAALATACAILAAVGIATGQLARGFVALTPHGVHNRSWRRHTQLPWDSVSSVDATGTEMYNATIQVRPFAGRGATLSIPAVALAPDPALLYHALRFYHANPAARAELADRRGLVRLRQTPVTAW